LNTPSSQPGSTAPVETPAPAKGSLYLGIDLGGTSIKAGLLDDGCASVHTGTCDTPANSTPEVVVEQIAELGRRLADEAGVSPDRIAGVGIGVPGLIDSKSGIVKACVNLKDWHDVPLREMIAAAIGKPTVVDNDANAAAFGEFSMALEDAPDLEHLALVTLGTGVGAGIVLGRQVFHGGGGLAGEIGHMIVVPEGHLCNCGQSGCLERYISATAMVRRATERIATGKRSLLADALSSGKPLTTLDIFQAAAQGDGLSMSLIEDGAKYLAIACINLCRVIDLQMIIIGGGVANAGDALLEPLGEAFNAHNWNIDGAHKPTLHVTSLGNNAGYIGAGALIMSHLGVGRFA